MDESNPGAKAYNIAIVGGGMAGVTAALSFAQQGFSIALVEAVEPHLDESPSFDQRSVALSASSVQIYQSLGLWPALQSQACPIKQIHVSDRGNFGFTRLNASDYALDALGEVIPLSASGPALWQKAAEQQNITLYCPAKVSQLEESDGSASLYLTDAKDQPVAQLEAELVIAADGTFSAIADAAGIAVERQSYRQVAIIANIACEQGHANRAFERFTSGGPLALLPMTQNRMSLVWCHRQAEAEQAMQWDDDEFCRQLQSAFGYRLGKISRVGLRSSYPLSLHSASQHYRGRLLLLGNAAHTLHPIAGQGLNLGLRDIAALNDLLAGVRRGKESLGSDSFMQAYVALRQADWQQTLFATDALARLFSRDFLPLTLARNKVMWLVNQLPFAKRSLARAAMGYNRKSPRLARGLKNPPLSDQE